MGSAPPQSHHVIELIKSYLSSEGMERKEFAHKVGRSESTINKIFSGIYSQKTLSQIEKKTGLNFVQKDRPVIKSSPETGGYIKEDYESMIGNYIFYRRSDSDRDVIDQYPMQINWNKNSNSLCLYDDKNKLLGSICIPRDSVCIFIPSTELGWCRLIIVSKIDDEGKMRGSLTTMGQLIGNVYMPAIYPVLLIKDPSLVRIQKSIEPSDTEYSSLSYQLDRIGVEKHVRSFL